MECVLIVIRVYVVFIFFEYYDIEEYCSNIIIDEIQLSSAYNTTNSIKLKKQPPPTLIEYNS